MQRAVIISAALVGARELITELGGDPAALALAAGVPERAFDAPDLFVDAGCVVDFLELAARECGREDFGLLHARRLPLGVLGQGWMLMRAADTVGAALRDFADLYGLYTDAGSLRSDPHADGSWLDYTFLPVGRWPPRQIVLLTLGCICLFVAARLGRPWRPARAELMVRPAHSRSFVEFFGPGLHFGAARDAVWMDRDTLSAQADASRGRQLVHRALARETVRPAAAVVQVKALLGTLLRHDGGSIETVCAAMRVTPRTLQRRLTAAGTRFRVLQDEVRAEAALRHVQGSDLNFGQVADLLGYDSQAAFSRAFRRWHGITPRAARRLPQS